MGDARQARPASRAWRAGICRCSRSTPTQFDTLDQSAGAPAAGSCRPRDPIAATIGAAIIRRPDSHRQRAGAAGDDTDATPQRAIAAKPLAAALLRTLLYGRNVDRNAKARAARPRDPGLRRRLCVDRAAPRDVRRAVATAMAPAAASRQDAVATARPDILDRNGEILATDVRAPSLFAEPRKIIDVDEAIELLTAVLPDLDATEVRDRLVVETRLRLAQARDHAKQQQEIHRLGLPGVGFLAENKRVYPNSAEVSHLIGHVNIDNQGIAGIEKWLDGHGLAALHMAGLATDRLQKPVELAVDLRVQHALRDELITAREKYKAKAAAGLVVDVNTGEIVAMVSLPDYDPNNPKRGQRPDCASTA